MMPMPRPPSSPPPDRAVGSPTSRPLARRATALLLAALAAVAGPARAGELLAPRDCTEPVVRTRVDALVLWSGGREELILRPAYRTAAAEGPPRLAWIEAVPADPEQIAVEGTRLFEDWALLYAALEQSQVVDFGAGEDRARRLGASAVRPGEGERRAVRLQATLLPGAGAAAASALRQWLSDQAFRELPPAALEPYAGEGWRFVVVLVLPPEGQSALARDDVLPPLRLSFATPAPVFPARLVASDHAFDVAVSWITRGRPAYLSGRKALLQSNLVLRLETGEIDGEVRRLLDRVAAERRLDPGGLRFVLKTQRDRLNGPGFRLGDWNADPTLSFE